MDNQDTISIVVLDDGETWSGGGQILHLTRDAYNRLVDTGMEISDLDASDIVQTEDI